MMRKNLLFLALCCVGFVSAAGIPAPVVEVVAKAPVAASVVVVPLIEGLKFVNFRTKSGTKFFYAKCVELPKVSHSVWHSYPGTKIEGLDDCDFASLIAKKQNVAARFMGPEPEQSFVVQVTFDAKDEASAEKTCTDVRFYGTQDGVFDWIYAFEAIYFGGGVAAAEALLVVVAIVSVGGIGGLIGHRLDRLDRRNRENRLRRDVGHVGVAPRQNAVAPGLALERLFLEMSGAEQEEFCIAELKRGYKHDRTSVVDSFADGFKEQALLKEKECPVCLEKLKKITVNFDVQGMKELYFFNIMHFAKALASPTEHVERLGKNSVENVHFLCCVCYRKIAEGVRPQCACDDNRQIASLWKPIPCPICRDISVIFIDRCDWVKTYRRYRDLFIGGHVLEPSS